MNLFTRDQKTELTADFFSYWAKENGEEGRISYEEFVTPFFLNKLESLLTKIFILSDIQIVNKELRLSANEDSTIHGIIKNSGTGLHLQGNLILKFLLGGLSPDEIMTIDDNFSNGEGFSKGLRVNSGFGLDVSIIVPSNVSGFSGTDLKLKGGYKTGTTGGGSYKAGALILEGGQSNISAGTSTADGGDVIIDGGEAAGGSVNTPGNIFLGANRGKIGVGTSSPTEKLDVSGNIKTNSVFKAGQFTAAQAGLLTAADGDLIYVTSTDATFTSVGFWGYEAGSWNKL